MRGDMILLCLAYALSQFYRAFLAVLAQVLEADIGAYADDLALASGMWFLGFAAMQLPVGWALDHIGPRRTASSLLMAGGAGGAALFAAATGPGHVIVAMLLIGIGCSAALMASYYIFARVYPATMFATLGAVMIGVGSVGNLAGTAPLAWSIEVFGWRETLAGVSVASAAIAAGLWIWVKDPPPAEARREGSVFSLLKMPALWLIFPLLFVNYAPSAGLRGLWVGPYFTEVYGLDAIAVGNVTLAMGMAMIVGTLAYGPADRIFGTRKWVVFGGNLFCFVALLLLVLVGASGLWVAIALFAVIGASGLSFPLIMAHGRSFVPEHLAGRGITLMNLFSIGGVGVAQVVTGRIHASASEAEGLAEAPFHAIFLFFAAALCVGLVLYFFSRDRLD